MDYKCKECGKIYEDYRPEFCECGNDKFAKISSQYVENDDFEKKESPLALIIFVLIAGALAFFLSTKIRAYKVQPTVNDEYLTSVRQEMLKDFNPAGITRSGSCVISFEINDTVFSLCTATLMTNCYLTLIVTTRVFLNCNNK